LHYQFPNAQAKLIQVVQGEVFDVAVDIRRGSPSFGNWVGVHLSDQNKRQLYIPEGCICGTITIYGGGLMQILSTGANGQVGWELARKGPEYGFDTIALSRDSFEICDFQAVKNVIKNSDAAMVKQLAERSPWSGPNLNL